MSVNIKYVTSPDGTAICAEETGDRSAPAVVFIHGLACTAAGFDNQFNDPQLSSNLHLVRYEMRGHGRSDKPEDMKSYSAIRHAEDFRTVCEAFRLDRPFVLGWSLGGCIPVDIVHYFGPKSISGVIYIGGALLSLNLSAQCRHPLFKPLVPLICSSDAQVAAKSAVPFVDSCVADPAALSYSTKLSLVGGFGLQPPIIRYFSLNREQDDSRWREQARHIPVVIIQGTEDTHCMYEVMIGLAKSIYDQVEVHLMHGVGHSPHIERPQDANRHILAFVRSISQPRYFRVDVFKQAASPRTTPDFRQQHEDMGGGGPLD
ncbi:hypothetical protein POSPLADRAFT_1036779 [Postia placenta MAD-698-R-SB12]|uniref:AB hydrolase-1 domain-containing protein n=1 Tax=Postia placenta MAD-698-R-SB12 TaxID=670580 RepID=A0A1X6MN03_9APHY|nr:hypothetical protein POSPLADRAFT_1036779 [Postia placenta MAD-698-R-SB12]OSX57745.1 hypothetical protein POSPLADRAFT_1036779 [Postia placenta MAD-698-R-SB12]